MNFASAYPCESARWLRSDIRDCHASVECLCCLPLCEIQHLYLMKMSYRASVCSPKLHARAFALAHLHALAHINTLMENAFKRMRVRDFRELCRFILFLTRKICKPDKFQYSRGKRAPKITNRRRQLSHARGKAVFPVN